MTRSFLAAALVLAALGVLYCCGDRDEEYTPPSRWKADADERREGRGRARERF
jgi:predicted small lipoprotein YifL